jgi:cobalt-zinc-cadmium efflux system protein
MSQHHHHDHEPKEKKALWIVLFLNGIFLVGELIAGFWTNSLALLSDAGHMVSDVGALGIALVANYLASKPTTPNRSFGYSGAQALGGFANSIGLFIISVFIFLEVGERLSVPALNIPAKPVLLMGIAGLIVNVGSAYYLAQSGSKNVNIRGALAHMAADALGSLGAILAALGLMLGYAWADVIASVVIAIIILWSGYQLLKDCLQVILGFTPKHLSSEEITQQLLKLEYVVSVKEIHLWTLDGVYPLFTAHVFVTPDCPRDYLFKIKEEIIKRFEITHSTIQIEYCM